MAGLAEVPVVRLDHLSADEQRAYLLADNRLALEAGWDRELLAFELQELQALDFDLPALGFSLPELDSLFEDLAEARTDGVDPAEEAVPELGKAVVTRPGDIWLLGNHRLINGDARSDTHRLSRFVIAASIDAGDYMGWRTRRQDDASPNAMTIPHSLRGDSREPVNFLPPDRPRAALTFERARMVEDLVTLLRRERQ